MAFLTSATFVLDGSQIFDRRGCTLLPLTDLQRTSSFVLLSLLYNKEVSDSGSIGLNQYDLRR